MKSANGLIILDRRRIKCFTHQLRAEPCCCSCRVASIIERIDLGCASNLMRVRVGLAATIDALGEWCTAGVGAHYDDGFELS